MSAVREFLVSKLEARVPNAACAWLDRASREVASGVDDVRFAGLISLASRHVPRDELGFDAAELASAFELCEGWNPDRWNALEAARVVLLLSRPDLSEPSGARGVEEAFRYADVGELCALYRSLALLPAPERFTWRAGEGCRTSMRAVFEAAACDTPFPFKHFDEIAWRQLVIKCVFIEAPMWRVYGLDLRVDAELARMALDLVEERRSAGRPVPHELWLCLGRSGGARAIASLEQELAGTHARGRRAAAFGLARAGELERLTQHLARESDPVVKESMRSALKGRVQSSAFRDMEQSAACPS